MRKFGPGFFHSRPEFFNFEGKMSEELEILKSIIEKKNLEISALKSDLLDLEYRYEQRRKKYIIYANSRKYLEKQNKELKQKLGIK